MTESMLNTVEATDNDVVVEEETTGEEVSQEGKDALDAVTNVENEEGELILGKFKDQEALVESYTNLEKKLVEDGKIAPQKYSPTNVDGEDLGIPEDDPDLVGFNEIAKESGISQEAYSKILSYWQQMQAERTVNVEAEKEKLGSKADDLITGVSSFYKKHLSEEEMQTLSTMSMTADQLKVLDKIRGITSKAGDKQPAVPTPPKEKPTMEMVEAKLQEAQDLYKQNPNDPKHLQVRKEARAMLSQMDL
jgi:hypothetical protein